MAPLIGVPVRDSCILNAGAVVEYNIAVVWTRKWCSSNRFGRNVAYQLGLVVLVLHNDVVRFTSSVEGLYCPSFISSHANGCSEGGKDNLANVININYL